MLRKRSRHSDPPRSTIIKVMPRRLGRMVVYASSKVGVCSPEKTMLVWRVIKLVLPVEGVFFWCGVGRGGGR